MISKKMSHLMIVFQEKKRINRYQKFFSSSNKKFSEDNHNYFNYLRLDIYEDMINMIYIYIHTLIIMGNGLYIFYMKNQKDFNFLKT